MHFMESREKLGPRVYLGAVCCSFLPEGLGPEVVRAATSACCCQRQVGMTTPRFWTCEREEEKERYEKTRWRRETALYVGKLGVAHQEEFWFW